jgi:hypothetical protein
MQGLIIELPPLQQKESGGSRILFGPPPKTKDDFKHLIQTRGVICIVNLCPFTNERSKGGIEKAERYMEWCNVDLDHPENTLDVTLVRVHLDVASFEPKGRNKELKKESWGQFYASHVRSVEKETQKIQGNIYIHHNTGILEEVYVAVGLWKLRRKNDLVQGKKFDFFEWTREHNYEWLIDEDVDKKELLGFVLAEIDKDHRKTSFFKKVKKDE